MTAFSVYTCIMKKIAIIVLVLVFTSFKLMAQNIPASEAGKHIGKKVTICGKVMGGRFFENSEKQHTLLNVGDVYPNNPLTIVIEGDVRKKFTFKPEEFYLNKDVCITGEIKDYKGKPEIVVTETSQIAVTEPAK